MARLSDRVDAMLNPIMVKEVQQGFRGRGLVFGAALALLFCLTAYAVASLAGEESGESLFMVLRLSMAAIALIIIPVGIGLQLQKEIESRTIELIAITRVSAWSMISGRVQGAGIKLFVLFALMAPYTVAAVILGGVGFLSVAGLFLFLALFSLGLCSLSLMLSATTVFKLPLPRFLFAGPLLILATIPLLAYAVVESVASGPAPFAPDERGVVIYFVVLATSASVLLLRMAADLLTPPTVRSYAASKLALAVAVLVLASPAVIEISKGPRGSDVLVLCGVGMLVVDFFSVFWSSTRVEHLAPRGRLGRLLRGGYLGTALYTAVLTALLAACIALSGEEDLALFVWAGGISYFVFFTGAARALRRLLDRSGSRVWLMPFLVFLFIAGNVAVGVGYDELTRGTPSGIVKMLVPMFYLDSATGLELDMVLMLVPLALGGLLAWLGRETVARAQTASSAARAPSGDPADG